MAENFDVSAWLVVIGMGEYISNFLDAGFEDWPTICTLTDDDLKNELQINKLGHRRRLLMIIAQMNQQCEPYTMQDSCSPKGKDTAIPSAKGKDTATPSGRDTAIPSTEGKDTAVEGMDTATPSAEGRDTATPVEGWDTATPSADDATHHQPFEEEKGNIHVAPIDPTSEAVVLVQQSSTAVQGGSMAEDEQAPTESKFSFIPHTIKVNPAPKFVPTAFKHTPFVPTQFRATPFVRENFEAAPFVREPYTPGKLDYQVSQDSWTEEGPRRFWIGPKSKTHHRATATAVDSYGNKYEEYGSNLDYVQKKIEKQFSVIEENRQQSHQAIQQAGEKAHETVQQANKMVHDTEQSQREQQHNTNEYTKEQQHIANEQSLEQQFNRDQQQQEQQHNAEQQNLEQQVNNKAAVTSVTDAAAGGALSAFTNSAVSNSIAYSQGKITGVDATKQVIKDTVAGGVVGGAIGAVPVVADRIANVQIGGVAISAAFLAADTCAAIHKYWKGQLTGRQCAETVARTFTVKAGGAAGAAAVATGVAYVLNFMTPAGPLLWALPIIGSALGYSGGAYAADYLFSQASDKIYSWMKDKDRHQVLKDAYNFLGVNSDDPNSVVERAYRELALQHHPDRGGDAETFTKLAFYMEIIRAHRENRHYFEDHVLLLGYQ